MTEKELCMSEVLEDKIVTGTVMEQIVLTRDNCKELLEYINYLQKQAELGEHYKHLYSEVKKQKDNVVEYVKNNFIEGEVFYSKSWLKMKKKELLRMLGEKDVED